MILAVVLARGGSKRLPRKNILPLHGKPLISYVIDLAKSLKRIDEVVVSTDSEEIRLVAEKLGGYAPFLRPKELASDSSCSYDAIRHALKYYEDNLNKKVKYIILLQPTSPFTKTETVEKAIELLEMGHEYVLTVTRAAKRFEWIGEISYGLFRPFLSNEQNSDYNLKSQFVPSGNVYAMTRDVLFKDLKNVTKSAIEVEQEEALDIDYQIDFDFADFLLTKKQSITNG